MAIILLGIQSFFSLYGTFITGRITVGVVFLWSVLWIVLFQFIKSMKITRTIGVCAAMLMLSLIGYLGFHDYRVGCNAFSILSYGIYYFALGIVCTDPHQSMAPFDKYTGSLIVKRNCMIVGAAASFTDSFIYISYCFSIGLTPVKTVSGIFFLYHLGFFLLFGLMNALIIYVLYKKIAEIDY